MHRRLSVLLLILMLVSCFRLFPAVQAETTVPEEPGIKVSNVRLDKETITLTDEEYESSITLTADLTVPEDFSDEHGFAIIFDGFRYIGEFRPRQSPDGAWYLEATIRIDTGYEGEHKLTGIEYDNHSLTLGVMDRPGFTVINEIIPTAERFLVKNLPMKFGLAFLLMTALLVFTARKPSWPKWILLYLWQAGSIAGALALYQYYDSLPPIGMFGGIAYIQEEFASLAFAFAVGTLLFVTFFVNIWKTMKPQ